MSGVLVVATHLPPPIPVLQPPAWLTVSGAKRLEANLQWPAELSFIPSPAPASAAAVLPVSNN